MPMMAITLDSVTVSAVASMSGYEGIPESYRELASA
jgi:hypothetical protein